MVRQLKIRYRSLERQDIDRDVQFLDYLFQWYSWGRMCVTLLLLYGGKYFKDDFIMKTYVANASSEAHIISGIRTDLFEDAVGLVAFGHLMAVHEVVDNLPHVRLRQLAKCLYLLPLPDTLNPLENPEEFIAWFNQNSDQIRWDQETEKYVFES